MQVTLRFPKFGVERRLPGIDRIVGEVGEFPLTIAQISRVIERDTTVALHVTYNIPSLVAVDGNTRTSNRNHLGAATREAERRLALAHLLLLPGATIVPDDAILRDGVSLVAPIGGDVGMTFGIGAHRSLVDEFAVLRDTAGIFSIVGRDGKYVGRTVAALPRLALVG